MKILRWDWRLVALYSLLCRLLMNPKIFTSEEVVLPPQHVANFLEGVNREYCARYLEFLIEERHEESPIYHDRLAELCLKMTVDAKKARDGGIYANRNTGLSGSLAFALQKVGTGRMGSYYYSSITLPTFVLIVYSGCFRAKVRSSEYGQ